jgi:superfamily II DNA/RNA helicase
VCYEDNRFYEEITDVCCNDFDVYEFRPFQLPAMTAALEGFDIILNSSTGSGKSLGYQVCLESGLLFYVLSVIT